jgi:integrase
MPSFGETYLGDINRLLIQSMIDRCPTYKTGKNARDTLSAILGHAMDLEVIDRNPARAKCRLKPRVVHEQWLGEVIADHAEHMRIIGLADTYTARAILALGLLFGLRKGEVLGLDWTDIDLKRGRLHVRKTYTRAKGAPDLTEPKTPKSIRTLPIGKTAHSILVALQGWGGVTRAIGPVLVHNGKRMSPDAASHRIAGFDRQHGLGRLTMSSMRHSFATAWVLAGKNVAALSKWLGHTNITTTYNRYVIPLMKDLEEEAKGLDTLYNAASGQ